MFGALQGCAVSGDGVSGGGSDQGQCGHAIGVDIVAIVTIVMTIGQSVGVHTIGPGNTGHAAVADNAAIDAVDAHAVTIITVGMRVYTIKQSAGATDKF